MPAVNPVARVILVARVISTARVIPAKAGIHREKVFEFGAGTGTPREWIPAFAGMTRARTGHLSRAGPGFRRGDR